MLHVSYKARVINDYSRVSFLKSYYLFLPKIKCATAIKWLFVIKKINKENTVKTQVN